MELDFSGLELSFFWKNKIKGLTTAASLWSVAAVGLAIGGGLYLAAFITTGLIVITLAVLKPVEKIFFGTSFVKEIRLYTLKNFSLNQLDSMLKKVKFIIF